MTSIRRTMNFILQPWQLLLAILSGWIHHRQQQMIEFQNEQIETLLKQLGKKRVLLTDGPAAPIGGQRQIARP